MRRLPLLAVVVLLAWVGASGAAAAADHPVSIAGFAFHPSTIDLVAGDSVIWTNDDTSSHNIVSATFASPTELVPGRSFSTVFPTPGEYSYVCTLHNGMSGTVRVVTAPAPLVPEVPYPIALGATGVLALFWWTRHQGRRAGPVAVA